MYILPFLYFIYSFVDLYILFLSLPWPKSLNNEHENGHDMHLKFDFKGSSCAYEVDSKKDVDDETLPSEIMRLVVNEDKQIILNQEATEITNLGSNEERKEVKISTSLSAIAKKEKNIFLMKKEKK